MILSSSSIRKTALYCIVLYYIVLYKLYIPVLVQIVEEDHNLCFQLLRSFRLKRRRLFERGVYKII